MFYTAFLIGLFGSFHCVGMCGPIAMALPVRQGNIYSLLINRMLYNLGRAITYSLIGIVFGLIGEGFSLAGSQRFVSIGAGVLILLMVLLPPRITQKFYLLKPAYDFTNFLKKKFGPLFRSKSQFATFFIGILNGFLPCGLVYIALAGAVASGSAINGMLYMFMFGLGTIPMLFAISVAGNFISINLRRKVNRVVIPVFMVVLGTLFILRGMNLGIPYISPHLQGGKGMTKMEMKH